MIVPGPPWQTTAAASETGGAIGGNTGVNKYTGRLDAQALQAGRWQVGALQATEMAGTPEAMALEASFVRALASARDVVLQDGLLVLKNGEQVLLRLEPMRLR